MNMSGTRRRWHPVVPVVGLVVGLLVLSAGAGVLGGLGWWRWWSPAPDGVIGKRIDTGEIAWFAEPFDPGQAHVASSTFEYVVVGFVLALVVGLVAGMLGRNRAVLTLFPVIAGSAFAAYVMWAVGMSFSPPDPQQWAVAANIGHHYPGSLSIGAVDVHLHLWSWLGGDQHIGLPTPCLVWPVGMLLGFLIVMLTLTTEERTAAPETVAEPELVE
ncbi:MAG TPA: hypothetical protein VN088_14395 [Nocardioides sp.]|nr:hypothetical protein [Nocardioides sp.]